MAHGLAGCDSVRGQQRCTGTLQPRTLHSYATAQDLALVCHGPFTHHGEDPGELEAGLRGGALAADHRVAHHAPHVHADLGEGGA